MAVQIFRDERYRNPYILHLTRGRGKVIGAGAVRMVGQPTESLTLLLPEFEIQRLALACLACPGHQARDYTRAWELIHFRERERRDKAERAAREGEP